jgi:hypothetical protein
MSPNIGETIFMYSRNNRDARRHRRETERSYNGSIAMTARPAFTSNPSGSRLSPAPFEG